MTFIEKQPIKVRRNEGKFTIEFFKMETVRDNSQDGSGNIIRCYTQDSYCVMIDEVSNELSCI